MTLQKPPAKVTVVPPCSPLRIVDPIKNPEPGRQVTYLGYVGVIEKVEVDDMLGSRRYHIGFDPELKSADWVKLRPRQEKDEIWSYNWQRIQNGPVVLRLMRDEFAVTL